LNPNYPNPFNSGTSVRLDIPTAAEVQIDIYDIRGKRIGRLYNGNMIAGSHTLTWQGRDSAGDPVPSGIYICRMEARSTDGRRFAQSVKMGLVR
jgi:flagellar hook assembly protein FlgD